MVPPTCSSTADFSSKDMVQDLNRLLKLEAGVTSTTLRELVGQCGGEKKVMLVAQCGGEKRIMFSLSM